MGKGVAKGFKTRYPAMYKEYREICDEGDLQIGLLHLWRGPDKWVLNFPTKTTWRKPSELHYVKAGLHKFVSVFEDLHISSISFPPLGCGNGNLDWADVRPLMESYLKPLPIRVFIHDRHVKLGYVPEHIDHIGAVVPCNFDKFLGDIKLVLHARKGRFYTLSKGTPFEVDFRDEEGLGVIRNERREKVTTDELEEVWSTLQTGLLSYDQFSGDAAQRNKTYLFAVLAGLPYVQVAQIQNKRAKSTANGIGLYIVPEGEDCGTYLEPGTKQGELWQSR